MDHPNRSIIAAGGIVLAVTAVLCGINVRNHIDLGGLRVRTAQHDPLENLVASNDQNVEIPETNLFYLISEKVKSEYVDSVTDDMKLAVGAVRGMVLSLNDPRCRFMDAKEFANYRNSQKGVYEGIGVDLILDDGSSKNSVPQKASAGLMANQDLPKIVVASVVPGGPADKVGVKPGDWVESIDGHWIPNSKKLKEFRDLQREVTSNKRPATDLTEMRKELRKLLEESLLPTNAMNKLRQGATGQVKVVWNRGSEKLETVIAKAKVTGKSVEVQPDNSIRLLFSPNAADSLKLAVSGKSNITIDLRNNCVGDFDAMRQCLAVVATKGDYGVIAAMRGKSPEPLRIGTGSAKTFQNLTLLTDDTTRGVAAIFAQALSAKGKATLKGKPNSDRTVVESYSLPNGAGYTLATGEWRAK